MFPMLIVLLFICSFPNTKILTFTKRGVDGMTDIETAYIVFHTVLFSLSHLLSLLNFNRPWPWPPMAHVLSWRSGVFRMKQVGQLTRLFFQCFSK